MAYEMRISDWSSDVCSSDLKQVPASFFFTGTFYMQRANRRLIRRLVKDGHYLGPHSGSHLLYAPWEARDSTLITRETFIDDLRDNYQAMAKFGIPKSRARYFLPPYRSEEHTSELQSLMRISYAVFCL